MNTSHPSRNVLSLAGLFLATLPTFAEPTPALTPVSQHQIEQAVLEANAAMTKAANTLNADAFFEFISTSDNTQIVQNGVIFATREESLQAVKRGMQGMVKIDRHLDNPKVTVLSPELALLTSDGSVTAVLGDGRIIDSRFAVSLVFTLEKGRWKVLHGHYSQPQRN